MRVSEGMVNYWSGKGVLVTGATGFIGSHLIEELLRRGARVRVLARPRTPELSGRLGNLSREVLDQVDLCYGDVREPEALATAVRGSVCLFHLAALISIPYSYEHPREVLDVNTLGTLNSLLAAREARIERVIVVSSSEVYGTARYVPIDEEHPLQAQSPYAASKIAAEKLAESFSRTYELPVTVVRPFNAYGPRQSLRAVIPAIIAQALFVKRIKVGTLTTTRDFTYVQDTVEGLLAVAEWRDASHEVLNLGSGRAVSISEVVERVKVLTGTKAPVEQEQVRIRPARSEVERLCANADKAKRMVGWAPRVSLDDGLAATITWMREGTTPDDAARYHY